MKPETHSVQIPAEVYQNLIDHLAVYAPIDSWANRCLQELTEQATEVKKCCRCIEPATEEGSHGDWYCHRHWVEACTEGEPSHKAEEAWRQQHPRFS